MEDGKFIKINKTDFLTKQNWQVIKPANQGVEWKLLFFGRYAKLITVIIKCKIP